CPILLRPNERQRPRWKWDLDISIAQRNTEMKRRLAMRGIVAGNWIGQSAGGQDWQYEAATAKAPVAGAICCKGWWSVRGSRSMGTRARAGADNPLNRLAFS